MNIRKTQFQSLNFKQLSMKATARNLLSYGNCTLVQLEVSHESEFSHKPGGPAIKQGGLTISESGGSGVVGKLVAVNNTDSFLLLTDADVLTGAKQNRVLNKSVLLSPYSKTMLDVSCIERGRWHYTTHDFSSPSTVADHDLRKSKARSVANSIIHTGEDTRTQHTVWSHISDKMQAERCESATENYSDLVFHKQGKQKTRFPACEPEYGCNGLAVLSDGKIACIDIFGREEVYRHYFQYLRDSAFLHAVAEHEDKTMDIHEAMYRVNELMSRFELSDKTPDVTYSGAGSLLIGEAPGWLGFELECGGQRIHCCLFGK